MVFSFFSTCHRWEKFHHGLDLGGECFQTCLSKKTPHFLLRHSLHTVKCTNLRVQLDEFLIITHTYCGSAGKESACDAGDPGSIPGLGRPPGEGKGYPLQYSGLRNSLDCLVHGVTKSQTQLSDLHFHFHVTSIYRKI